jgi:uncharacterized glyoxalase superfamily protein PhnB
MAADAPDTGKRPATLSGGHEASRGSVDEAMVHSAKTSALAANAERALVPVLSYRNATAMVDWLVDAYGFEKRRIVRRETGEIDHAELAFGDSKIRVVPAQDATLERLLVHPDQIGGVETQACYLIVPDIDAHRARASAKGAEIMSGLGPTTGGQRTYASRDPEGHVWMFGTYDPAERRNRSTAASRHGRGLRLGTALLALAPLVLVAVIAAEGWTFANLLGALEAGVHRFAQEQRGARQDAERAAKALADDLTETLTAKESAERGAAGLATQLAQTRAALEIAVQSEKEARGLLEREMRAREGLAQTAKQATDRLEHERAAREAAEKAARDATDRSAHAQTTRAAAPGDACEPERRSRMLAEAELARERSAKAAAEIAASELRTQLAALGSAPQGILALRDQLDAERRVREAYERSAKDAQLQLVQEKYSHDATERTLKQAQERLAASSCWACPSGAPCSRPQ